MPQGDGTGPRGEGPGTGRGMGVCGVERGKRPGQTGGQTDGQGRGRGRRGRRNRFLATGMRPSASGKVASAAQAGSGIPPAGSGTQSAVGKEQELNLLKRQADGLANTLDEIKQRIAELETQPQEG